MNVFSTESVKQYPTKRLSEKKKSTNINTTTNIAQPYMNSVDVDGETIESFEFRENVCFMRYLLNIPDRISPLGMPNIFRPNQNKTKQNKNITYKSPSKILHVSRDRQCLFFTSKQNNDLKISRTIKMM